MEFSLKFVSLGEEYLVGALMSALFAAGEAIKIDKLAVAFDLPKSEIVYLIECLEEALRQRSSAFELCRLEDAVQLCTKKEYAEYVQKVLEIRRTAPLSRASLEALSIVAYKQPVTKTYIEQVRGVDCTGIMNTLIQRELIEECGRLDAPGRPILYRTTPAFLRSFGLSGLDDLPGENSIQLGLEENEEEKA